MLLNLKLKIWRLIDEEIVVGIGSVGYVCGCCVGLVECDVVWCG